jgi:hypothetical protein
MDLFYSQNAIKRVCEGGRGHNSGFYGLKKQTVAEGW